MEMIPKISIIIPMYNVEGKMDKCIRSLCNQTMSGLELVFVDDCCTDHSIQELQQLLEKYNTQSYTYKIVKHLKNSGVAAARNTGLENSTGEYIYFVDADDYIESCTINELYLAAILRNADIIGCEWYLTFKQNERHVVMPDATNGKEMFTQLTNGVMRWNLWLFLVKRSLYVENNIRFIEGENMGEDMMVMIKLSLCANNVCIIHKPLYHYIQTNINSLTKSYQKYKSQISNNINSIDDFIVERGLESLSAQIDKLKLAVKLPLLISCKNSDYEEWQNWFNSSNYLAKTNYGISTRTYLLQMMATRHQYWFLKLYYYVVIKFIYGIVYK